MTPAPLPPSSALFARLTPDQRAAVERAALKLAIALYAAPAATRAACPAQANAGRVTG